MARILVVDDDPLLRGMLTLSLSRRGYDVATAEDGAAGLKAFDAGRFDLVITDLMMPHGDGIETLRGLRRRSPHLPVIVASGESSLQMDYLDAAMKLGATAAIRKPFKAGELVDLVEIALAGMVRTRPAVGG